MVQQRDNAGEGKFFFVFFCFGAEGGSAARHRREGKTFCFLVFFFYVFFYMFSYLIVDRHFLFLLHFFCFPPPLFFGFAGRMMSYLIEDRHATVVSYVDFLCHIHSQIQAKLV